MAVMMRLDVSQFLGLLPELFTEFWVCDADQRTGTLADALAIKVDSAVFCHDPMDVIAGGERDAPYMKSICPPTPLYSLLPMLSAHT